MYRGEAANHGILDCHRLCKALEAVHSASNTLTAAMADYEDELQQRTKPAVLLSRQACLDAHDFNSLNEDSAVLKRRAIAAS
jgi:2-polyprenyl-6-methoxyphenol hydroxylase-like FAD-dependent oxidoreductase